MEDPPSRPLLPFTATRLPSCLLFHSFAIVALPSTLLLSAFVLVLCNLSILFPSIGSSRNRPVVFFPGYTTSRLRVTLNNQTFSPYCPPSADFEFFSGHVLPWSMSEECVFKALKLLYNSTPAAVKDRFSSQPGVTVQVMDFGLPPCAPIYFPLYLRLLAAGYSSGHSLFVACYDFRTSPDVDVTPDHSFINASKKLVEEAYWKAGGVKSKRVVLMGHSNGVLMALALLASQPQQWIETYIGGFVSFAGNWAGQGSVVEYLFSGLSFSDFSSPRPMAAFVQETWPATYFSLAQPWIYGGANSEVIVKSGSRTYTPSQYSELFRDGGLKLAPVLFPLFNSLTNVSNPPHVPQVLCFYGSGIITKVGIILDELKQGVYVQGYLVKLGDGNQESADNTAVLRWSREKGLKFSAVDLGRVRHILVPFNGKALAKTILMLRS